MTPELMEVLDSEDCNCYSFGYGFESGSQRILDIMKKDTTREENINAYKLLEKSKYLKGACSLMVGNVGEDDKSIKETLSAIKEGNISDSAVFFTQPYPGGRIWDWCIENKIGSSAFCVGKNDHYIHNGEPNIF